MSNNSLKKELTVGVFYTAVAKYGAIVVSLVVTAILARLLSPEDFGVVAISTIIINFFGMFSELGIGPAIIQNQQLSKSDLSSIFSFTVYLGIAMGVLFFFCAEPVASYYENPKLEPICRILSVCIFFASLSIVPNALIYKEKKFKLIAQRTIVIQFVGGIISVIGALNGMGIYALLINPILANAGLFAVSFYYKPQQFRFRFEVSVLKLIYHFSVYQFLFNVINYFSRNLDKLMIGKHIGMSPLGYYEKSYRLMMLPLQNITQVITPVMHPIFAQFQNDLKQLSLNYLKIVKLMSFIGFPLSVFLFFAAKEVILITFGDQWLDAVPVFRILSLSVAVQIILSSSGSMFQAANATRAMFLSGLLSSIVNIGGLFIAIFWYKTLESVAWALVITFTFNFFQCYWILFCRIFKQKLSLFFKTLISPVIISVLIGGALYVCEMFIAELSIVISLIVKGAIYMLILGLYIQIRKEYDLIGIIKSKLIGKKIE